MHGLYYAGLHVWGSAFGFSPFAVRLPSAIAVGLTTAAVVLIADRLRSRRAAIIAGSVCMILPRVTYMGEEARSYAFSAAIVAWLTFVLLCALERERSSRRLWIAYGALLALGICTFLYVGLFIVVHVIVVAIRRPPRRVILRWAAATGAALLIAAPVIVYALLEHGQVAYLADTEQLAPDTLFSSLWFGQWTFAVIAWLLIAVAVAVEGRRIRTRRRDGHPIPPGDRGSPALAVLAVVWLLVPTLTLIGLHTFVPDFRARYVSFCAPAAALLIACGIDDLLGFRRWLGIAAGVLCILLAVPVYLSQRTPFAKNDSDLAQISAVIGAGANAGDAVVFDESPRPSRRPRLAIHAYPAGFENVSDVTLKTPYSETLTLRDATYTVTDAAALGRFARIARVWLVEYASSPGHADAYGARELASIGFHRTETRIPTHRGVITLYERTP